MSGGGDLVPGTLVGEYVVEGVLARGGMATLYSAVHPVIRKRAVVKVPSSELSHHAITVERFVREARAVNLIAHPNVVDIFGFGQLTDGQHYLVMERLEGETLAARLRRFRLSHSEVHEIVLQLSDMLDPAHAQGVLHLDLKPDNVFLVPIRGARTLVKVLDFGLAAQMDEPATRWPALLGTFRGTPEYASPEQAQGLSAIGPERDVYSLGVMAFEMLVGARPFSGATLLETLLKHIGEAAPSPSSLSSTVSPDEDQLVLRMLDKRAEARPTPAEVRERLLAWRTTSLRASTQSMPQVEPKR